MNSLHNSRLTAISSACDLVREPEWAGRRTSSCHPEPGRPKLANGGEGSAFRCPKPRSATPQSALAGSSLGAALFAVLAKGAGFPSRQQTPQHFSNQQNPSVILSGMAASLFFASRSAFEAKVPGKGSFRGKQVRAATQSKNLPTALGVFGVSSHVTVGQ